MKVFKALVAHTKQSIIRSKVDRLRSEKASRVKKSVIDILRSRVALSRQKTERSLLLKVFLQWKEYTKNNQLLHSYLMEEKRLVEASESSVEKPTQKERFLNLIMPQLGKYSEANKSRSGYFEMSERGLDDTEDHSNSFADFKSAV